jgi:hypothetical protein
MPKTTMTMEQWATAYINKTGVRHVRVEQLAHTPRRPWLVTGGPLDGRQFPQWDDVVAALDGVVPFAFP